MTSSPFNAIASSYAELWTDTPNGRDQRAIVWREIDGLFRAGDRILDLGCGIGDDALHLAELGIEVLGIDAAPKMVEAARSRGVNASVLAIEDLHRINDTFSGAISNFGALNCVADLRPVASQLARVIQPGGPVALCLMERFCAVDLRHAVKRWLGRTTWRGMEIYYPTSGQVRAAFAPWFAFERRISIAHGDHQLYIFRRATDEWGRRSHFAVRRAQPAEKTDQGKRWSVPTHYFGRRPLTASSKSAEFGKMGTGPNFRHLQLLQTARPSGAEIRACTRFFQPTCFYHGLLGSFHNWGGSLPCGRGSETPLLNRARERAAVYAGIRTAEGRCSEDRAYFFRRAMEKPGC